jgi:hypothetical protein
MQGFQMHNFLIALVFVAMVASPALIVPSPSKVSKRNH